jgi:hypothetical protein
MKRSGFLRNGAPLLSAYSSSGPSCFRSDKDPYTLPLFFGQEYETLCFDLRDYPRSAEAKLAVTAFAQIPSFAVTNVDEIVHDNCIRLVFKEAHHDAFPIATDGQKAIETISLFGEVSKAENEFSVRH